MIKFKNLVLGIKDQLPAGRLFRNVMNGNVFGLFSKRSHFRDDGSAKVSYNTKSSARRSAHSLTKKRGVYFSNYKCIFCDGYHIGKNRTDAHK